MFRANRGASLLELLFGLALLLLISTILVKILVPVFRTTRGATEEISMQQSAGLTMEKMVAALHRTAPGQFLSFQDLLAVRTLENVTAEGDQVWSAQCQLFYYEKEAQKLWWNSYDIPPEELSEHGFQAEESEMIERALSGRILVTNLEEFEFEEGPPVVLRCVFGTVSGDRRLVLERKVHLALKNR